MIQTNLREIDADLDPDQLIRDLKSFGATVLLFNTGGIVASYPTKLPFHYPNPYLKNDLVGEVIKRCHENGIRYLARMDFSKANRVFYGEHPDWFYRTASNSVVDYNGQLHTCVNGPYQREHALAIVEEVLQRYPVDGFFFNMFGYQTRDYSGNYHGICHCENCRRRFREQYGHELPRTEDPNDPVYRLHQKFRADSTREVFDAIVRLIRSYGDHIAIAGVDWIRKEVNTSVDRPLPLWVYEASAQAKAVMDSWPKRAVANAHVHFVDIPYRHVSVPPHQAALRVAQNLASGAWLDFYCIGPLDRQEDRPSLELVRELYLFHQKHAEEYYTDLEPAGKIALLAGSHGNQHEFRGLYRMLVESHKLFDVLEPDSIHHGPPGLLNRYDLVVAADPARLHGSHLEALDAYVEGGGRLLVTGRLPVGDAGVPGEGEVLLKSLGAQRVRAFRRDARAAYFKISPAEPFPSLQGVEITFLDGYYQQCDVRPGSQGFLRFVPPCMYGPPEKCYYEVVTDEPGMIAHRYGKGISLCIPWPIGALYYRYSSVPHWRLVVDAIDHILQVPPQLQTDASEMVFFNLREQPAKGGRLLLHLVNASGHHGTAFFAPVPMHDVAVTIRRERPVSRVIGLKAGKELDFTHDGDWCSFRVPKLELFEAVVIE